MFATGALEAAAGRCRVLLANPPFEDFKREERERYLQQRVTLTHNSKPAEMLARIVPHLQTSTVFGLVLPQSLLYEMNAQSVRRQLIQQFELREITLLAG